LNGRIWLRVIGVAAACLCAGRAPAQGIQISPETVASPSLSSGDQAQVSRYAAEHGANLGSDDPEKRRAGRRALLAPLGNAQVSAAFRLHYARELEGVLRAVAGNPDDRVAVNALIVAGDLATETSTGLLVEHLRSERPALRFQAGDGLRRTFEALQSSPPAVQGATLARAVAALRDATGTERDAQVLKSLVGALLEAARVPPGVLPDAQSEAVAALSAGLGQAMRTQGHRVPEVGLCEAYHKGVRGVRDLLAQPGARPGEAAARHAGEMAGRLVALVVRCVRAGVWGGASEAARAELILGVASGETLVQLCATALGSQSSGAAPGLANLLRAMHDKPAEARFVLESERIVGDQGVLVRPPFSFPRGHFLP
jgi:hypothetical protein